MGRTSDEEGETSAKTCRSDDSSDRPLKKARYVWQIKGKYHLKKPENEEGAKLFIADETRDGYTLHPVEMSHSDAGGHSLEAGTAGDSTSAEVVKSEPVGAVSPPALEEQSPMESEDLNPWQLQKWQARQVARCFVDNTINRVLEDMGFVPLPVDADDILEDFTMAGIDRNDAHLEDAAVMMAIHSHGLQRAVAGIRGSSENLNTNSISDTCICNFSLNSVGLQDNYQEDSMERMKGWNAPDHQNSNSSMYDQSPGEKQDFIATGFLQEGLSLASQWIDHDNSPKCASSKDYCDNKKKEKSQNNQNAYTVSENSMKDFSSEHIETRRKQQMDEPMFTSDVTLDDSQDKSSSSFEHTDFMDKAVAVAIQKKGLSTLSGIEYG
ncbi:hypothetical protein C0J52_01389 [Blattella germanica]|nr:hypothetical protein C0J52_01389 [Blattella germanica]